MALGYSMFHKALIIVVYVTLNKSINILNKYILGMYGFRFPLFVSACHQAFCFLGLAPAMYLRTEYRTAHRATLQQQWRGLLAVSALFACSLALNNYSLTSIPLSLNQVIRASLPVVTALLAISIEGFRPGKEEMASLVVLTGGVMVAIYEGSQQRTSVAGLAACVAGTFSNGCLISASGKLMSERIDAVRLTFYIAPLTAFLLLPLTLAGELDGIRAFLSAHPSSQVLLLLILSCGVALAYNMIHNLVINVFSSVTTTVLGEVKIVGILLLSAMFLGESRIWSPRMALGVVAAFIGVVMYARVHRKAQQAAASLAGSNQAGKLATTGSSGYDDEAIQVLLLDAEDFSESHASPRPANAARPAQPVGMVVGGAVQQPEVVVDSGAAPMATVVVPPPDNQMLDRSKSRTVQVRVVKN